MLSYDRVHRYASADEVIADLERLQNGVPPHALNESREQDDRTVRASFETIRASDPGSLTMREPLSATPAAKRSPAAEVRRANRQQRVALFLLALLGGGVAFGAYTWWHEYRLVQEAKDLSSELERKTDISLNDWKTYQDLAERSWTNVPPREPARIIKERYKEYAASAIKDYREGLARALTGPRRQNAEVYLQRVLDLDSSDRQARSMLLVMQAYGIPLTPQENGRKAIGIFEQAARLDSRSPDPYLGIARVAVYTLRDPDRAASAQEEAKQRGYVEIDRDRALLADGYRYQAFDLWKSMRGKNCDDVDRGLLDRVRNLLERSIDLYRGIPQFSGTQANLESVRTTFADVNMYCRPSWWKIFER